MYFRKRIAEWAYSDEGYRAQRQLHLFPTYWFYACGGRNILLDIRLECRRQSCHLLSYRFVLGQGVQNLGRQMCWFDYSCGLSLTQNVDKNIQIVTNCSENERILFMIHKEKILKHIK